jgi:hypothetical protein
MNSRKKLIEVALPLEAINKPRVLTAMQEYGLLACMKATIDIPDDLYRKLKAKSALEGQPVPAVAVRLFRNWVGEKTQIETGEKSERARGKALPPWFGAARKYARKVKDHSMDAVRESIAKGWASEVAEKEARVRKGMKR